MRKLLMSLLLILLIVLAGLSFTKGIKIGGLEVYGITALQDLNADLDKQIEEAKTVNERYTQNLSKLKKDISTLTEAKEECLNLINVSTDSQIKQATQTKNYTIEYLWSRLGNHATSEGVTINIDITAGTIAEYRTIRFTVAGNYLAITNFITSLENDPALEFTIDDFTMSQSVCNFTVKDVKIKQEKTSVSTQTNNVSETENNTTKETTSNTTNDVTENTNTNTNETNSNVTE